MIVSHQLVNILIVELLLLYLNSCLWVIAASCATIFLFSSCNRCSSYSHSSHPLLIVPSLSSSLTYFEILSR